MSRLAIVPHAITSADAYRCAQVIRILRLMRLVQSKPCLPPLAALANTLEVCERTVRRDLHVLRAVGITVPPSADAADSTRVSLPPPIYALDIDEPCRMEA